MGSAPWIADERAAAYDIVKAEIEDFTAAARNEVDWLNEHMAEIFNENEMCVDSTRALESIVANEALVTSPSCSKHRASYEGRHREPFGKPTRERREWYVRLSSDREMATLTQVASHCPTFSPPRRRGHRTHLHCSSRAKPRRRSSRLQQRRRARQPALRGNIHRVGKRRRLECHSQSSTFQLAILAITGVSHRRCWVLRWPPSQRPSLPGRQARGNQRAPPSRQGRLQRSHCPTRRAPRVGRRRRRSTRPRSSRRPSWRARNQPGRCSTPRPPRAGHLQSDGPSRRRLSSRLR